MADKHGECATALCLDPQCKNTLEWNLARWLPLDIESVQVAIESQS